MAGSTFKAQKILAEGIMSESPQLIEAIISNPELRRIAEEFWKDMGRMLTSIQDTKIEEIVTYINACKERLVQIQMLQHLRKKWQPYHVY